jgi:hypothetical protein
MGILLPPEIFAPQSEWPNTVAKQKGTEKDKGVHFLVFKKYTFIILIVDSPAKPFWIGACLMASTPIYLNNLLMDHNFKRCRRAGLKIVSW